MAEVVSIVLETLKDFLLEEGKLLGGIEGEVKALQNQLTDIKCLLKDAERQQQQSELVRNWIAEFRDLSYRAEDAIASYAVEISAHQQGRGLKRLLGGFKSILSSRSLQSEISDIRSELGRVTKSINEYGIRSIIDGAEREDENWERMTFPYFQIGDCFVGKEDELKKLCYLVGDDKQHRVISVWGMGGIGKTTIAKKVYNQMIQTKKFQSFAWVCITQQCQIRTVLEGVLKQLNPLKGDRVSSLSKEQLIQQLCRIQREKRCLIVVDDLWEVSHWNGFKHAFLVENLKSKILVTTRKKNVAEIGFAVKLELLKTNEAWELLKKKSFPHGKIPDFALLEELHKIGKEMVRKCGYLPLAISLLGGVLSKKHCMREWVMVNSDIDSSIYRGEEVHDGKGSNIEQVMNLSYQDLPYFLKPCILFLARLREDEIILAHQLYWMWIAQGMITHESIQRKDKTLMEIAELYLSELASRCIVQVDTLVEDGSIPTGMYKSCKLHDVVRELCVSIGKSENFGIQILEYNDGKISTLLQEALLSIKTRHLVMHFERQVQLEGGDCALDSEEEDSETSKCLRSLEIRSSWRTIEFPWQSIGDLRKFKMLKTLVIVRFKFTERKLPRVITCLVHLKYLHLEECELDELPSSISNLTHLETLNLYGSWDIRIPNVLKKFLRIKHLILPSYSEVTTGNYRMILDGGYELETLWWFDSSVHELASIARMKNLRRLTAIIRDNESLSTIINAIATEWTKLQYFVISIEQGCKLKTNEGKKKLKQLFTCPNLYLLIIRVGLGKQLAECGNDIISSRLSNLVLQYCEIKDDPMLILGKHPTLQFLRFWLCSFVGEELTCRTSTFPRLKKLEFCGLPNWKEWRVEQGAMPLLSELEIANCANFQKLPDGLTCISTLQKLTISGMPELAERVSEWGKDFHKVRHVPSIIINHQSPFAQEAINSVSNGLGRLWRQNIRRNQVE